jgi:hypothetical protein
LEESFFDEAAGDLIASLRALSVALITSVANIDRSFGDNWFPCSCAFSFSAFLTRGFAGVFIPFPPGVFEAFSGTATVAVFEPFDFGSKRSFRIVAVAGEQVDVDATAARIESAVACKEAIIKQNTITVLLEIRHGQNS